MNATLIRLFVIGNQVTFLLKFCFEGTDTFFMSAIKPINFAQMYLQQNRVSGSDLKRMEILVDGMKEATDANHRQIMAPSPIKPLIDAGSISRKVEIVLDGAQEVSEAALNSTPPKMATALKKLNII